ncbi:hypothetical protein ABZZ36_00705 [Actinacidiphila glaucinigra]|uniref:hypothetical protein n=1 Tax=Actinacidiphila glaucinigra TaxID=235986 RepID=UPI0033A79960
MEKDLPVLLERILPHLALPSDRMTQVRRRIQQRRRRRRAAATASVLAVGCAVVATVLWPAAFGPGHGAAPAAAPAVGRGFRPVHPQEPLEGVITYLPTTWHTLSVRDEHGTSAGFVSSQTLRAPGAGRCPRITDAVLTACPPLAALDENGALITFLRSDANRTGGAGPSTAGGPVPADGDCRAVGGDRQLTGWAHSRSPGSAEGPDMKIDVCLKEPSQETLQIVAKILTWEFPTGADRK